MFRCVCFFVLFLFFATTGRAQIAPTLQFGIEQDVLPYVTSGYFAGAWAGKNHLRLRALTAHVHKPNLVIKDGFTNNKVSAYAVLGDYFLQQNWHGWWLGSGLVYWRSSISEKASGQTAAFSNWLLNGSCGYNWNLSRHVYLSPWAGLNLRLGGASDVPVGASTYHPPLLNPEASLKAGFVF